VIGLLPGVFRKRWFLVTGDITKGLLFPFDKIHHRAGDGLLAFECSHTRAFAERHSALVEFGHLGCLNGLIATLVIEHQKAFVRDNLVFVEQLFGAGKIPLRIDMLDIDLSLTGILIFRKQILNVRSNRSIRRKENGDAHLAPERIEKTLRFI